MLTGSEFLFERNGFRIFKLVIFHDVYFVAEKTGDGITKRYIRKSLPVLEKMTGT